jgi:hypothetical protein
MWLTVSIATWLLSTSTAPARWYVPLVGRGVGGTEDSWLPHCRPSQASTSMMNGSLPAVERRLEAPVGGGLLARLLEGAPLREGWEQV